LQALPEELNERCLGCNSCLKVCPTGIDIRRGYQIECINCARCLDACRIVMAKRGEEGIIRYTVGQKDLGWGAMITPKTVALGLIVTLIGGTALFLASHRAPATFKIGRSATLASRLTEAGRQRTFFSGSITNRDPGQTNPGLLLNSLSRIGYLARPFTRDAAQQQAEKTKRTLLIRFGTATFLSMQLMGYSFALYAGYLQGIDPTTRHLIQLFAALVTTPVVFCCGFPFLAGAWHAIRNLVPNMDLLISLGVPVAYLYSLWALANGREVYFDTAAMIVTLILLGRLLENAARRLAGNGIGRLLRPPPQRRPGPG
jgi:hypothetical protein